MNDANKKLIVDKDAFDRVLGRLVASDPLSEDRRKKGVSATNPFADLQCSNPECEGTLSPHEVGGHLVLRCLTCDREQAHNLTREEESKVLADLKAQTP